MIKTRFDEPRRMQCILKLSRIVTIEQRRRLVCIPDRMMAENERDKLQRQHGPAMTDARISKNGKGKEAVFAQLRRSPPVLRCFHAQGDVHLGVMLHLLFE